MICADCPINSVAVYQAEIARLRQEVERLRLALRPMFEAGEINGLADELVSTDIAYAFALVRLQL